jgi:hypothetical protein
MRAALVTEEHEAQAGVSARRTSAEWPPRWLRSFLGDDLLRAGGEAFEVLWKALSLMLPKCSRQVMHVRMHRTGKERRQAMFRARRKSSRTEER